MSKKALMHAHTAYHLTQFNIDNIKILQEMGYTVDVAACWNDDDSALSPEAMGERRKQLEDMGCKIIETASLRKIFAIGEMRRAYKTIKAACDENQYEIVHTQSPIGGVICRLACRKARKKYGTKVLYMAHGFHFFAGAPKKNWIIFYNAENFCARFTDLLVTINEEDYLNATLRFGKRTKVVKVNGIGIDTDKYAPSEGARERVRKELGLADDQMALLSIGELIPRKNHETVIRAIARLKDLSVSYADSSPTTSGRGETPQSLRDSSPTTSGRGANVQYYIAGRGRIEAELKSLVEELGLQDTVHFLGFRTDIADVIAAADIFVFPSHQEGLPAALMEVMAVGKPVVASKIRGNVDLIKDGDGGFLCASKDVDGFANNIQRMLDTTAMQRAHMGETNRANMKSFDKATVNNQMKKVYEQITADCR